MAVAEPVTAPTDGVLGGLAALAPTLADRYRDLHRHPELSSQEHRTAGIAAGWLRECGFEVHEGLGGTGVVGVLANGAGPTVLLRADMDALPVKEATGLPYASTATGTDAAGATVPVMHACGHDMHVTCLMGAARLLAQARDRWHGTVVALFQPAEETGVGARGMVEGGLARLVPKPDVVLGQHVLALPAGAVGVRPGLTLTASDSFEVTVYGRGGHASMPHLAVDPVLLAASIVVRLQGVVAREVDPSELAVVTVGSIVAGTRENVIADHAVLKLNIRSSTEATRTRVLDAVRRIVRAECLASNAPREPEFEVLSRFPVTLNDEAVTAKLSEAFRARFGERFSELPVVPASEDFTELAAAWDVPSVYWFFGGGDPERTAEAVRTGRLPDDVPVNHSPRFAPVVEPTLSTGVEALVTAALAWLV